MGGLGQSGRSASRCAGTAGRTIVYIFDTATGGVVRTVPSRGACKLVCIHVRLTMPLRLEFLKFRTLEILIANYISTKRVVYRRTVVYLLYRHAGGKYTVVKFLNKIYNPLSSKLYPALAYTPCDTTNFMSFIQLAQREIIPSGLLHVSFGTCICSSHLAVLLGERAPLPITWHPNGCNLITFMHFSGFAVDNLIRNCRASASGTISSTLERRGKAPTASILNRLALSNASGITSVGR